MSSPTDTSRVALFSKTKSEHFSFKSFGVCRILSETLANFKPGLDIMLGVYNRHNLSNS